MRLGGRESENVEDRRGGAGIKVGGLATIAIVLIGLYFGVDPALLLQLLGGGDSGTLSEAPASGGAPQDDGSKRFVSLVLAETEDTWSDVFRQLGRTYREPKLVLFSGATQSAARRSPPAASPRQRSDRSTVRATSASILT